MPKKALVTGSAGFIGRHMFKELEARGYQVDGYDDDPRGPGWIGDVNELFSMSSYNSYDLVVHCAFHVGGRAAIDGTNTNFLKNLQLDSAMFDWAVRTKQKRVLYFSSSAAYPVGYQTRYFKGYKLCEEDIDLNGKANVDYWDHAHVDMTPDSNYGWAKLTGERMAQDARRSGLQVSVVRPASGCGPTQSTDYPWPSIIKRAMDGDLSVWGNPDSVRDWIDVSDVINGALVVVESGTEDPVNLGTGVPTSMRQLATLAFQIANPGQPVPEVVSIPGPEGVFYRVLDPTRLHRYYAPKLSVEEMVRATVQALRASSAGE